MKNMVLNTLHAIGLTSILRMKKANRLTVLSLHRISDERNFFWDPIMPNSFDLLLRYVKQHYHVITFSDLFDKGNLKSNKPLLILSFDDGYYDFYENALPLLTKHGLVANHNVVNACCENGHVIWTERLNGVFQFAMQQKVILEVELPSQKINLSQFDGNWMQFYLATFRALLEEKSEARLQVIACLESTLGYRHQVRMMNWEEVKECSRNGVEIGSHTMNHDVISTLNDKSALKHELSDSKLDLEKKLNLPIQVLALPNGQIGDSAYDVIRESDYKFVLHVDDRSMPISDIDTKSGYSEISRINMVDEPFPQMCLRAEQFHSIIRGNAR
ncbi:MAG: peptidoglycan/xylan/chitin deacetylase (PgdA/CDA1 family) [Bacteroidia bacterium]|jgi:peptidoglycan/xylan/chitin deacetylase (PgdA/CDA1 family)